MRKRSRMDVLFVKVYSCSYKYDNFLLGKKQILRYNSRKALEGEYDKYPKPTRRRIKIYVDGMLVHYIVQEFLHSQTYCESFIEKCLNKSNGTVNTIKFIMLTPPKQIIDYDWNYRISNMVREVCELEHTLSWLSTLGGAFSALGDYFINCAEVAGKISYHQLNLALRLEDPNIVSRCKLYFSLSLIQQHYFKTARKIIQYEYVNAKSAVIVDTRLIKMCKGIWAKLQYEHEMFRRRKKLSKIKFVE